MFRTIRLLLFFMLLVQTSVAQVDSTAAYTPPKFPDGIAAFNKYVITYIHYPSAAYQNDISGHVDVVMYISKEGKVKLVRTSGKIPEFNAEVKRVFKLSPNWEPGRKKGVAIDTMINQTVWFSLQGPNQFAGKDEIQVIIYTEPIGNLATYKKQEEEDKKNMIIAQKLNEEGSSLLKEKKFEEALLKFNAAIEKGGKLNAFLFNRGLTYLNLKQDDKAKEDFLEAYRKGDEDAGKIYNDLFNK